MIKGGWNDYLYAVAPGLVFYTDSKCQSLDQRLHAKNLLQLNYILLLCFIHCFWNFFLKFFLNEELTCFQNNSKRHFYTCLLNSAVTTQGHIKYRIIFFSTSTFSLSKSWFLSLFLEWFSQIEHIQCFLIETFLGYWWVVFKNIKCSKKNLPLFLIALSHSVTNLVLRHWVNCVFFWFYC